MTAYSETYRRGFEAGRSAAVLENNDLRAELARLKSARPAEGAVAVVERLRDGWDASNVAVYLQNELLAAKVNAADEILEALRTMDGGVTKHTDRSVPCPTCGFVVNRVECIPFTLDDDDDEPPRPSGNGEA